MHNVFRMCFCTILVHISLNLFKFYCFWLNNIHNFYCQYSWISGLCYLDFLGQSSWVRVFKVRLYIENVALSEWRTQTCFLLFLFTQDALCSQPYFISSEGDEPHLERWKQKTEVEESEKMKGNCKTQIKTCYWEI